MTQLPFTCPIISPIFHSTVLPPPALYFWTSKSSRYHANMSNIDQQDPNPQEPQPRARPVGGSELSWCKAVPIGTGITVLALLLSKRPDIQLLQNALQNLQSSHPILRSRLHLDASTRAFSFTTPISPHIHIQSLDLSSTVDSIANSDNPSVDSFHLVLEQELNKNSWHSAADSDVVGSSGADSDLVFASSYALSEKKWAVVLRVHTSVCDRASAEALLRELLVLVGSGTQRENKNQGEVSLGIENFIPDGKGNKPFWARGVDLLGYSLNSFRLSNLDFLDAASPRCSQVVRLQMNPVDTSRLISVSANLNGKTFFNLNRFDDFVI
uniref:Condensation domain-containing protein n=1 Tax=Rhizophora mucronata TaxID=61149 RepID=A0A2P2IHZ4_RHIMU